MSFWGATWALLAKELRMRAQSSRAHLKVGVDGEVFILDTPLVITAVPQSVVVRVPRL